MNDNDIDFTAIETPCLILDRERLGKNAKRFLDIAKGHKVALRTHLKTVKSVAVAKILTDNDPTAKITVSTLLEAEYFSSYGFKDILYAVGIGPNKFARVAALQNRHAARIMLITDNVPMAHSAAAFAGIHGVSFDFLIEIDSGDHRSGVLPDSDSLLEVAQVLHDSKAINLCGVLTHAGQSYSSNDKQAIAEIAEHERAAVVMAADRLMDMGVNSQVISMGSTPTVACARDLTGITEVRCGVYPFFDLDQYGRGICGYEDMALSVLATVTGHQREAGHLIIDAGGLALSKDISAQRFLPDAGYGYVCNAQSLERYLGLSVTALSQEHGKVAVRDAVLFDQLPIGAQLRVLPNHACFTAAAYPDYQLLERGELTACWPRVNGW